MAWPIYNRSIPVSLSRLDVMSWARWRASMEKLYLQACYASICRSASACLRLYKVGSVQALSLKEETNVPISCLFLPSVSPSCSWSWIRTLRRMPESNSGISCWPWGWQIAHTQTEKFKERDRDGTMACTVLRSQVYKTTIGSLSLSLWIFIQPCVSFFFEISVFLMQPAG